MNPLELQDILDASEPNEKHTNVIYIRQISTPLGPMFAGATEKGICLMEFADRKMLRTELKDLQRLLKAQILPGTNIYLEQAQKEMEEYFLGTRKTFDVQLDAPGTEFQKRVWAALLNIPYGKTVSYKHQATILNNLPAIRAVASANGHNRVSIIIPCHRVIGENGNLTGYGGGLPRKRWLINFENENYRLI